MVFIFRHVVREVEVCGMRGLLEVWIRNAVVGGRARRKERGNIGEEMGRNAAGVLFLARSIID